MSKTTPDGGKPTKSKVFGQRTISTVVLWGVVLAAFLSRHPWAYLGIIGTLTLLASREYFRMLKSGGLPSFPRFGVVVTMLYSLLLYLFLLRGVGIDRILLLGIGASFFTLIGSFVLQLRYPIHKTDPVIAVAGTVLGFIYLGLLFNFAAQLLFIVPGAGKIPGALVLLWVVAVTKFTDMGAYLVGSLIGKHKMIPHVSPAKTWQGFGGALFFAVLIGTGLYWWLTQDIQGFSTGLHVLGSLPFVAGLSLLLALLAVLGDLAASLLKRSLQVKDSGHILPGIGGAIDLIDSLCFTVPVVLFYQLYLIL